MLVFGHDKALREWASLGIFGVKYGFSDLDVAIGAMHKGKLIAAVVYSRFVKKPDGSPLTIEMSIYSIDKRWATRHNLKVFFAYPFNQLGLERVQTLCSADEEGVIAFNKRLGFTQEGVHRKLWHNGGDAISWSMLKHECKWL